MPYIKPSDRNKFDVSNIKPETAGELNYVISELCARYIQKNGLRYQNINEVMGVLSSAQAEFYRRVAASYEDKKIAESGDTSYAELDS